MDTPTAPDIGAQIATLRTDRLAGTVSEKDFHARMDVLGPQWKETPAAAPPNQVDARAQTAVLTQQRIDGKISQADYFKQMEASAPVAEPDAEFAPDIQRQYDADMAPPADPNAYRFEYPAEHELTADYVKFDSDMRVEFQRLGIPQAMAAPLYATADRLGRQFANASPADLAQHESNVADSLRKQWGDQFDGKIAAINAFVATAQGPLAELIQSKPWILSDAHTLTSLDHLLQYTQKRKG